MKVPENRDIVFTLYSHPAKDPALRWKATLTFRAGSTDDSDAIFDVRDVEGNPIPAGTFDFAGRKIAIRNGEGALKCADFVRGKHEGAIWFQRKGGVSVPGALTFE